MTTCNYNLLSLAALADIGMEISKTALGLAAKLHGKPLLTATNQRGLYTISTHHVKHVNNISNARKNVSNIHVKPDDKDILLWHARLGHISLPTIHQISKLLYGLQIHHNSVNTCTCEACILGKKNRRSYI
jgi:hypothetical protein